MKRRSSTADASVISAFRPSTIRSAPSTSKSGITKMDDWINAKRPQKISTIGPGTSTSDIPKLLKAALNLPMDVIDGYKGGADARLAVESGEVDGYCGSWGTVETVWRSAYESKKIIPVLQATLQVPIPKYKQIPLAISFAKTEEARELLKIADDVHGAQFPFSVPPGMAKGSSRSVATRFHANLQRSRSDRRSKKIAVRHRSGGWTDDHEDAHRPLRSQTGDGGEVEGNFVAEEEIKNESVIVARDRLRLTAEAVRPIPDTEGAGNIPWTQVADASLVEEVLRRNRWRRRRFGIIPTTLILSDRRARQRIRG